MGVFASSYDSDSTSIDNRDAMTEAPEDDRERVEWLMRAFGEPFCRKLGIFRVPENLTVSVVIPVYNEKNTLREILRQVRAVPLNKQIILVDDCSTDGTRDVLKRLEADEPDLTIQFHDRNQGKGAALRTGFALARGQIVIVQDADLEYDPAQYPQLIQPIVRGQSRRRLRLPIHRRNPPRPLLLALDRQQSPHAAFQYVYQLESDGHGGLLQGLPSRGDSGITLKSDRFGFEPEVTAKVARFQMPAPHGRPARRRRVHEMPVSYNGRDYNEGKKIGLERRRPSPSTASSVTPLWIEAEVAADRSFDSNGFGISS